MSPRIGELFAGYGGLGMGVQAALGGEVAWYSEIDKGALKILTHRFPDVPNIGDITTVDWSLVEPVDILTGGSPCQDLSHAGKRAGMTEGTRSNLWVAMREAIAQLQPGLVIWENVRGAYSAAADSDLEPCAGCLGDSEHRGPSLRALGRVLGDLSDLGYVGGWHGLRAADVGACHPRFRVFIVATDTNGGFNLTSRARANQRAVAQRDGRSSTGPLLPTPATSDTNGPGTHGDGGLDLRTAVSLMPTPRATDGTKGGPNQRGSSGDLMLPSAVVSLLPTPAVNDMGASYTPEEWDAWTADMQAKHGNGNGHGKSLSIEAQRLLPTPVSGDAKSTRNSTATRHKIPSTGIHAGDTLTDVCVPLLPTPNAALGDGGQTSRSGERKGELLLGGIVQDQSFWGIYSEGIARWESIVGRPAPKPTMTSTKGNQQLDPEFVTWMMGLPAGWITEAPEITRNEALRALGNGVVPQQAEAAIRFLVERLAVAA